ncbi:MAG: hypothetical protein ACYC0C_16000 [Devosia sp.]
MTKKPSLDELLKANPKAQKQEQVVRDAVRDLERLRKEGFGGRGYTLTPPFGEKRQGLQRAKNKLTLSA